MKIVYYLNVSKYALHMRSSKVPLNRYTLCEWYFYCSSVHIYLATCARSQKGY